VLKGQHKFRKEVRVWALILINRVSSHERLRDQLCEKILQIDPPNFLAFLLSVTDPEDTEFTHHSLETWIGIEDLLKRDNKIVMGQFEDNYILVEKLLAGTKRTVHSKSGISPVMRNIVGMLKGKSPQVEQMMKEAAVKLG